MPKDNNMQSVQPHRPRRGSMIDHIDDDPLPPTDNPEDIAVLVDAWDQYLTVIEVIKHGLTKQDGGWLLLAAVALRHVFERLSYDPSISRLGIEGVPDAEKRRTFETWVVNKWPAFCDLNKIANSYKHCKLIRTQKHNVAKVRNTTFSQYETATEFDSIWAMANAPATELHTVLTILSDDGEIEEIAIEETLHDGLAFLDDLFRDHFPEKTARRSRTQSR